MLLIKVSDIEIDPLPHQEKTVKKVINQLKGRAILADEVGLGKTIEAGMILKKYLNEGQVENFLILVPASLGFQWTNELVNKFNIEDIFYNRKGRGWEYFDYQIASIDKAKRKEHARFLKKIDFDLVIVDEAHKLKNHRTLNWKFVNSLKKKFCLLLTATPLQNKIREIYNLVALVRPDLYENFQDFKKRYGAKEQFVEKSKELKNDLCQVMVRNCHQDTILEFTDRQVEQISVKLSKVERKIYDQVTDLVKKKYQKQGKKQANVLNLLTYQRELCSSFAALKRTLNKKESLPPEIEEILPMLGKIGISSKLQKTLDIINDLDRQVLIFTEFRATQDYIAYFLEKKGYDTIQFNGGFSMSGKEYIKHLFEKERDVMISTKAGSQGLNLQFCNSIINYDLPWNPMKLEQRIGRIHRLGQTREVYIYNLVTKNTIEEKILQVLYKKMNLLEEIVGGMDNVIVGLEEKIALEKEIIEIIGESGKEKIREKSIFV